MKKNTLILTALLFGLSSLQNANAQSAEEIWNKIDIEYQKAYGLYEQENYQKAKECFLKVLEIYDDNKDRLDNYATNLYQVYGMLGYSCYNLGEYESAIEFLGSYLPYIDDASQYFDTVLIIGTSYFLIQNYEEAVYWYESVTDLYTVTDEQKSKLYFYLAWSKNHLWSKESEMSEKYYELAIDIYTDYLISAGYGNEDAKEMVEKWFTSEYDKTSELVGKKFAEYESTEREAYIYSQKSVLGDMFDADKFTYSKVGSHVDKEWQYEFMSNGRCRDRFCFEKCEEDGYRIRIFVYDGIIGIIYDLKAEIPYASRDDATYFYIYNNELHLSNGRKFKATSSFKLK